MEEAKKSFELQAQVRQNAEVVKNTLNDLYNWEKEIKDKEKKLHSQPENNVNDGNLSLPVRSHIKELDSKKLPNSSTTTPTSPLSNGISSKYDSLLSPSSEKQDTPYDPLELKHKEANEIKDRGNKHVKMAEYPMAIEAYTQAIELYPDDAVYYSNRALCYLKLERYDECIDDCERAIDIDRLAVKAYYRRMMANESLGNNMDALKDCTTVLMIEPKNSEAKRSLERINERLRKNVKSTNGPNFSPLSTNLVDILPIDKPAYKRSTKPLSRIAIADVVGPKDSKIYDNLKISDEDIDKLFNSNCGHFEEVKAPLKKETNVQKTTNVPKPLSVEKQDIAAKVEEEKTVTTNSLSKHEKCNKIMAEEINIKERPLPPAPSSTAQFYSNWKELSAQQKYQYLKSIPVSHVCKILGADIIRTLHDFYLPAKDTNTSATLLEVSKNKQVSILSLLMSSEDRKGLSEIIKSLKENNSLDTTSAEEIIKKFNLN
ncbi:RNA polymerase II-associated protein 3 [Lucilia cuprina]|nr:RNA polymerase II-associated protein 3 [Lucilia cuprina]